MKKIIPVLVALLLVLSCCLVACSNYTADNTEHFDDITKTLKFSKIYTGKVFQNDGVGVATILKYTDGDTTTFLVDGSSVTVRYYGIDTPESTGGVEKWGKAASNFTKERLSAAEVIVLESSTGGKPTTDSVGQRTLAYVWYKTAEDSALKCLNLELVENGFSENKVGASEDYYKYFQKANQFARKIKLRLYSELDDPLYSDDANEITIKEFWENTELYEDNASKVMFTAYLTSVTISSTGTHTFVAAQYDEETGKVYEINVYTGYNSSAASSMKVGDLFTFVGTPQKYNNSWQISGIEYDDIYPGHGKTSTQQSNYYLTFDSTTKYGVNLSKNFYSDVTVTEVEFDSATNTLTFTGTAIQLKSAGFTGDTKTFTFTVSVATYNNSIQVGSTVSVTGLQLVKGSGEITVLSYSDITIK